MGVALVTGAAGFIGFHLCQQLLAQGTKVIGLDDLNDYYNPKLKQARLEQLAPYQSFEFCQGDCADGAMMLDLFAQHGFTVVYHLAAQAGVRHSLQQPWRYTHSNLNGFLAILEACRHYPVEHLLYASSSSVYGDRPAAPFSANDPADHPVSLYAATKRSNELMAHAYSHLFHIPMTGLRFFTVYGPWGRPDMAYYGFTQAILSGEPIDLYGDGQLWRDFTWVGDVVEAVTRLGALPPALPPSPATTTPTTLDPCDLSRQAPWRVLNIGNSQPVVVSHFVDLLEQACGCTAIRRNRPCQPGDVGYTAADTGPLEALTGFRPATSLADGLQQFVAWYRRWHHR